MWNIYPQRGEFVLLTQYLSPVEAGIVAGRLEAEGIAVMRLDEHITWNNQMQAQAVGGVKLLVRQRDLAAARAVLGNIRRGAYCPEEVSGPAGKDRPVSPSWGWTLLCVVIIVFDFILPVLGLLRRMAG
ncbi:TPA: DUF2007 domain-containing protein [Klebsiella oxytoca]|uniref:DUF2007 domain-containing protein n=1 Tax=Klebsiella oxytoca TaxID=571 RepID=A0AAN5L897_KLEOX|nr:DUF2007 domain-containing protein [Klebsiella oxytoca]